MDELFGLLLGLLDEKLFGEGGFLFFHLFFTADILLVPSLCFWNPKRKRSGSCTIVCGRDWPGSRTRTWERFLVETSGGDIGTIFVGHLSKERSTIRLATLMTGYD